MKSDKIGVGGLAVFALVLSLAGGQACSETPRLKGPTAGTLAPLPTTVPGQYIVTLAPGGDANVLTALYGRFGIKDIRDLGNNAFLMVLGDDPGLASLQELARHETRIKAIQPNFIYHSIGSGSVQ
jgi:hypothetical protein